MSKRARTGKKKGSSSQNPQEDSQGAEPNAEEIKLIPRGKDGVNEAWALQGQAFRGCYEEIAGSEEKRLRLCKEVAECSDGDLREQNRRLLRALLGASRDVESYKLAMKTIREAGCETCCYYPCDNCGELNHAEDFEECVVCGFKDA